MPTAPLAQARQRTGELARESGPVGDLGQQRGARVRHQPRSVRRDTYRKRASFAHHPQGDPPRPGSRTFSKPKNPGPTGRSGAPTPIGALALTHDRGLSRPDNTPLRDSGRGRARPAVRSENPRARVDAVEAWCAESPCDSVAWGPVEVLIAASSA